MKKSGFVLANPGAAPEMAYLASAFYSASRLGHYVAPFPLGQLGRFGDATLRIQPSFISRFIRPELERRAIGAFLPEAVLQRAGELEDVLATITSRAGARDLPARLRSRRAKRVEDRARSCVVEGDCLGVVARSGWALEVFRATRKTQLRILNAATAHPRHLEAIVATHARDAEVHTPGWSIGSASQFEQEVELADVLICYSNYQVKTISALHDLSDKEIWLAPLGVDHREFYPLGDGAGRGPNEGRAVVSVGRQTAAKGAHILMDAMRKLVTMGISGTLVGSQDPQLSETDGIRRLPHMRRAELRSIYSAADVFISASLSDAFGLTTLEAMACGLPVVCTENTGVSELVSQSQGGLVVPVGDADAIVDAVQRIVSSQNVYVDFAKKAHETALQYSWAGFVARIANRVQSL